MNPLTHRSPATEKCLTCAVITVGFLIAISSLCANPVQLLSARSPAVPLLVGGDGDSVGPRVSDDGRFIVFSSSANDLTPGGDNQQVLNVYLRDHSLGTTVLVSANTNGSGGNGQSIAGQASSNGRYVVFQSDASDLVSGDTNGASDIFLRDTYTGTTRLISAAVDGGCANGASTDPVITPDGTCVAFISAATNLVAGGDTNGIPDVFVRDLVTQTTWLLSVGATGNGTPPAATVATPLISDDGRYVAFVSSANNLAAGTPTNSPGEIYVRDRVANTTLWASINAATTVATLLHLTNAASYHPALSDDGRYVAFKTGWTNGTIAPGGVGVAGVVYFQYDTVNGTTTVVCTNGFAPWVLSDDVFGPEMTPDGRFIALVQAEPGKDATGHSTNYCSVRVWDQETGTNVLASTDSTGAWQSNSVSYAPALSADGRYAIFLSSLTNVAGLIATNSQHIYRRDLQTATTTLVDVTINGTPSLDQLGVVPVLSADGRYVAYATSDSGLAPSDNNNAADIFLWDADTGTNELISTRDPSVVSASGKLASSLGPISLSADGRLAAFASYAGDLVVNDANGQADVFVRDLTANSNLLVSVGLDGNAGQGGGSYSPILSADGRYVVFLSGDNNLVANDTNMTVDVFRRNLQSGVTELVSLVLAGVNTNSLFQNSGLYDASFPVASQDSRYIAFLARTNSSGPVNLFWRDMYSSSTTVISGNASNAVVTMSADGQRVAYFDGQAQLCVWDATASANIYTNASAGLKAAFLSPTGTRLLYQITNQLFIYDLAGASNLLVCPNAAALKNTSPWSGDDHYITFVTSASLAAGDNNGTNDVYLQDLQSGTVTLVSRNSNGTASAAGVSDSPVISSDGRFVAFRSFATDVVPGIAQPPSLVVYDRLSGTNSLLATGTAGAGWTTWLARPALSRNAAACAFTGWDGGLVNNDLNRAGDVFAGDLSGWAALDSDADGIPDWWMIQYFGHPTGQANDLSRAQDDADGDGMNNLEEFIAGLDPTDPDSVLALNIAADASGTNSVLSWNAVAGKNYQLRSTADLNNPVWLAVPGTVQAVPGSIWVNGSRQFLSVPATNSQSYFRVEVGN